MGTGFDQPVDPAVLARARAGDTAAHEMLFRCFGSAVYTLARRLVKRSDIAEEILQETFLDLFRQVGSYRKEAPFGFWLRRIAVNRSLMFLRSYWQQHGEALDGEWPDGNDNFGAALERADLVTLLERLPPTSRAVLWLHDVEGYTHQEIAEMMGKTASFSKSQLVRGHARLRAMVVSEAQLSEVNACTPTSAN